MALDRTGWLAIVVLALLGVGIVAAWRWPDSAPALDCAPEQVRWVETGQGRVARCAGEGDPLPAGAKLTLGATLDLNSATEQELALIPGVGPSLAQKLVEAREEHGGFRTWDEVDAVRGIGPSKLDVLQAHAHIRPSADAGDP